MTDFNLPAAYAELVAKRPELAVCGLVHDDPDHLIEGWMRLATAVGHDKPLLDEEAEFAITAKLLAELPRYHGLVNGRYREGDGWYVKDDNENFIYANTRDRYGPKYPSPLRALLAFHLKGTT